MVWICHVPGWHVEKKLLCFSLWEVLPVNKESRESLLIGLIGTVNIRSKKGSLWKKMMMWSVERSSRGDSEEGTEPVPCCTAVQSSLAMGNPSEAKTLKEMTTPVAFSCFWGISNVSARESHAQGLPASSCWIPQGTSPQIFRQRKVLHL